LFFEGTHRPQAFFALRDGDGDRMNPEKIIELEKYWNDIYNLFLRKLTVFAGRTESGKDDELKLQALLQELIKVKDLIENAARTDIMDR
jgi:hypothetical protein